MLTVIESSLIHAVTRAEKAKHKAETKKDWKTYELLAEKLKEIEEDLTDFLDEWIG